MGHHPDDGQQIQPRDDGVAQQRPYGCAVDGDGRVRYQQVVGGNLHAPADKQGDDRDALLAVGLQDACRGDHQAHKHRGDAQNAQVVGGGLRRLGHRRVKQVQNGARQHRHPHPHRQSHHHGQLQSRGGVLGGGLPPPGGGGGADGGHQADGQRVHKGRRQGKQSHAEGVFSVERGGIRL